MRVFGALEGYPTGDEVDTLAQILEDGNYTMKSFESWFLPAASKEYKSLFLQRLLCEEIKPLLKEFEKKYKIKVFKDEIINTKNGKSIFEKQNMNQGER